MFYRFAISTATVGAAFVATNAQAQITTPFLETAIPFYYDQGRNIAVQERARPEFDPTGIAVGGFTVLPRVLAGLGYTDNVFQTSANKKGDGFVAIEPTLTVRSDWSVHSLNLNAGARLRRYLDESDRNEDGWFLGAAGRLDVSSSLAANAEVRTARLYESQFSGAARDDLRTVTPFQASIGRLLVDMRRGGVRLVGAADYSVFDFGSVETLAGARISQRDRDRAVSRATGHAEFRLTVDASIFAQTSYIVTNYRTALSPGVANRDSKGFRVLGGISFDLSSLFRGSFGAGYTKRNYDSPLYTDIGGLLLESRIEYFPTQLTTVTLAARRTIEDSNALNSSGYFNTGGTLRIDHELLRNLILNASVDYEVDSYRGIDATAKIFRASGGARYLVNRSLAIDAVLGYADRNSRGPSIPGDLEETRALLSLTVQR